jgi:hypothetical protein
VAGNDWVFGGNIDGSGNAGYTDSAEIDEITLYYGTVQDGLFGVEEVEIWD